MFNFNNFFNIKNKIAYTQNGNVVYSYDKTHNLIVFLAPIVSVSKTGHVIFTNEGLFTDVVETRHLIHDRGYGTNTMGKGKTLGYLDTVFVNNKRISQRFFPLNGITAISERKDKDTLRKGQSFNNLTIRKKKND